MLKKEYLVFFVCLFIFYSPQFLKAEEAKFDPAQIEQEMTDFTFMKYPDGEFKLSDVKDRKNLMMIFPRGYANKDDWCVLCGYQWAEWVELEKSDRIREKYNLEIVFVLPYGKSTVEKWIKSLPYHLRKIEEMKNPPEECQEWQKRWAAYLKENYPKTILYNEDNLPMPFPVLFEENHELSSRLDLYRTEWSGRNVEQNIPTVLILDKDGKVVFKYISQNTLDRPSPGYIIRILNTFLK
ncbi:MAG: redoxin domain-containing protein [Acidobacteria bacterium]|nr:redoxin domain-containing protein [Acidobacteriota bacterium]